MSFVSPTYVFTVNLAALNQDSFLNPDMYTENPTLGRAQRDAHKATRVTYIPGLTAGLRYELKHGATLTEHGLQGAYLYNTYCNVLNPVLTLVSRTI